MTLCTCREPLGHLKCVPFSDAFRNVLTKSAMLLYGTAGVKWSSPSPPRGCDDRDTANPGDGVKMVTRHAERARRNTKRQQG